MRGIVSIAATAILAAIMPVQAFGQMKGTPGTERIGGFANHVDRRPLFTGSADAAAAYAAAASVGRCMVRISGDGAAELIGGPNTDDEGYRKLGRAMQRRYTACGDEAGGVPAMVLNYGLAEALVLREDSLDLADRAQDVNVDEAEAFAGVLDGQVTMDGIARCLAAYSPGLAHKVVQSEAASPGETAALEQLYAQSPECGLSAPPDSIPSVYQRGSLAVALYQWTHKDG